MSHQGVASLVNRDRDLDRVGKPKPMPQSQAGSQDGDVRVNVPERPTTAGADRLPISLRQGLLAHLERSGDHFSHRDRRHQRLHATRINGGKNRFEQGTQRIALEHRDDGIGVDQDGRAIRYLVGQRHAHSSRISATARAGSSPHSPAPLPLRASTETPRRPLVAASTDTTAA